MLRHGLLDASGENSEKIHLERVIGRAQGKQFAAVEHANPDSLSTALWDEVRWDARAISRVQEEACRRRQRRVGQDRTRREVGREARLNGVFSRKII